jgi:putative addiction module antidote
MNVTIRKIGNSEGIIIPREVLNRLGLKAGDTLEIAENKG